MKDRRHNRLLKLMAVMLIIITVVSGAINACVISVTRDMILSPNEVNSTHDCMIVLGSPVYEDGSCSEILKNRLDRSLEIYQKSTGMPVICSGDNRELHNFEVDAMISYLVSNGINESDIVADNDGYCTYDSIRGLLEDFQGKSVIIITQKYHLYRALYIAHSLGINAIGIEAEEISNNIAYRYFREYMARVKDFAICLVNK
ncbi:MAG: YdcF family protein [Erysipelotrichaceae bacterium]|nr:YdcF family protein [Erysipelotrichaceae bacterium]